MKKTIIIAMALLVFVFLSGCERTEKAVDLYKKVKEDAKDKAKEIKEGTQDALEKKLKDITGTPQKDKQHEDPPQKNDNKEPRG